MDVFPDVGGDRRYVELRMNFISSDIFDVYGKTNNKVGKGKY